MIIQEASKQTNALRANKVFASNPGRAESSQPQEKPRNNVKKLSALVMSRQDVYSIPGHHCDD
jgi:hypothetical protein